MIRKLLKSWWFWVSLSLTGGLVYLYSTGAISNLILELQVRFAEERTFEEALRDQETEEWSYFYNAVTANVIGSDLEAGTLLLSFIWPPAFLNARFGNERPIPDQTIRITCPKEESSLIAVRVPKDLQNPKPLDTQLLESEIDIVQTAQSGDVLIGYCANESCSEINHACQLSRNILVAE